MFASVFPIVFSVLLFLINLFCSFWLFREALRLSGVTFGELLFLAGESPLGTGHAARRGMERRKRFILAYLLETSPDPLKTKKLFYGYCYSTIPGFLALALGGYGAYAFQNPEKRNIVLVCNVLLLVFNIALACAGKIYRKRNPLDRKTEEILEQKRREEAAGGISGAKAAIVYTIIGCFFLGVLLFFYLGAAGILQSSGEASGVPQISAAETADFYTVHSVLSKRGFETANIPTTYWTLDEDKLVNVVSGRKDDMAFEFYEYTDGDTTETVFNRIVSDVSGEGDSDGGKKQESALEGGGKIYTTTDKGTFTVVLYKENTVVYAHSPEKSDEIQSVLAELGYKTL